MKSLNVSFIVPLFNHVEHSKAMLASLQASLPPGLAHEIILVDDASTDGTGDWLQTLSGPNLRVVMNPINVGFARANHAGVALASGEVLALVNNDLIFSPSWFEPMLAVLQNPQLGVGVVGNVQTRVADGALDHAGVQVAASGKLVHVQELPASDVEHSRVFAVTGACCLIRRDVFDAVGGFDEAFVNGSEDVDLCMKVKAKGLQVCMAYVSVVQHHVSLSREKSGQQREINSRLLFQKWRKEFKTELATVWLRHLQQGMQAPIDGQFTAAMLATPHVLARVVADSMLQQEECYWARTLDQHDVNFSVAAHCQTHGLSYSAAQGGYVLDRMAELQVSRVRGARNFYVCGQALGEPGASSVAITLVANGIQEKSFVFAPDEPINAGIIAPVCLRDVTNRFVVSVSAPILVSHFVLDDQVVAVGEVRCPRNFF